MGIKEMVVSNIAFAIIQAVEKEVDGAELSKKLDELMDNKFESGFSEKLQRGPLTEFLFELAYGLYAEEPWAFEGRITEWLKKKETAK